MENKENKKKCVVGKIASDLKESTKLQHEITKARHEISTKPPKDALDEFKERHADAKKPPIQKQKEELARLQSQKKK